MDLDIDVSMTFNLTKNDLTALITEFAKKKAPTGYYVKAIDFKLMTVYSGYGASETSSQQFSCASVTMAPNKEVR